MDLRGAALLIAIASLLVYDVLPSDDKPVYFSLIISRGENGFNSSPAIPAIHIALEQIKSNNLLPGYNLTYEGARNSKVYKNNLQL